MDILRLHFDPGSAINLSILLDESTLWM